MTTSSFNRAAELASRRGRSLTSWLSRLFISLPMLLLILIGFHYISDPMHAAAPSGVALTTPEALTDTRVAGALALTVAFAIASCLVSRERLRLGHVIVIALMAFILAVRMYGFVQDGTTLAMGDQKVKTIGEAVFLVLNTIGFFLQTYLVRPALGAQ